MSDRRTVAPHLRVKREPHRGAYDRETIDAILDEALLCHLGFQVDGRPYVIPTLHARVGDLLYVHGSAASRMLRHAASGTATLVGDDEKREALRALTEQLAPGRWDEARQPTAKELKATSILSLPLDEASAKVRTGPEEDDPEDRDLPVWAGVVPVHLTAEPSEYDWRRVHDGRVGAP